MLAPLRCVEAVEAAVTLPFDQGLAKEAEIFRELMESDQAQAQRYFFFAERKAAKIPDLAADLPVAGIKSAAVIGAGTMGAGIAMCFANAGHSRDRDRCEPGRARSRPRHGAAQLP